MMTDTVDVCIEGDETPEYRYVTKVKTFSLRTADNQSELACPYNKSRIKAYIVSTNTGIVVTRQAPSPGQSNPTTAAVAPDTGIICGTSGNGFPGIEIYGPNPIYIQAIVGNANTSVCVTQTFREKCPVT